MKVKLLGIPLTEAQYARYAQLTKERGYSCVHDLFMAAIEWKLRQRLKAGEVEFGKCRLCGCTDDAACVTDEGPCYWVEDDLCSACVRRRACRQRHAPEEP